jgi:hypothetical protein
MQTLNTPDDPDELSPQEREIVRELRCMNHQARANIHGLATEYARLFPLIRPLNLVRPER